MPMFDDYSKPIMFDIELNDQRFTDVFSGDNYEWYIDIDDFYDYYFQTTDNLIITGSTDTFEALGPFITDLSEGN